MSLQLHNSLTRTKEIFTPIKPNEVGMYVCGPTVYNYIHVGNARPLVFFDVTRRYLEYCGYKVTFVLNFTDIDDKIIEKSRNEKVSFTEVIEKYIQAYRDDMQSLGIAPFSHMPRVTEHIPGIIKIVEGLIANGMAYVEDGEVFYSVRNFKGYGKLSGKNIDDLMSGARVEVGVKKKDPLDFSLWKPRKTEDEPAWDSPWGKGRPGWHIECSAMSMAFLGETFDIHGGGMDLIHPHHENEIAQSEGFSKKQFANYWLHNNMLSIDNQKMSKSLGNIFLTRDFVKEFGPETLKFLLLSGHYRSTIDFSERNIRDAQVALHRVYSMIRRASSLLTQKEGTASSDFEAKFKEAMDDDLNTAKVIGMVFEYVRYLNGELDRKGMAKSERGQGLIRSFLADMKMLGSVLNLFNEDPSQFLNNLRVKVVSQKGITPQDIEAKIQERLNARKNKDFATSDRIRDELKDQGIALSDSPTGTEWDVVL